MSLAGERLLPVVDLVDDVLADVGADHLVAALSELDGEGKPDLAEPDNCRPHW